MDDRPVFFSSVTDWRPKPFMRLLDFLEILDGQKKPNFNELAQNDAKRLYADQTDLNEE